MYPWVTHTHCHLGGECPHGCVYCYVTSFPFRPEKYQGPLRLIEKEFSVNYGKGKTIFVENCNDLFADEVAFPMIVSVMKHCCEWPENVYVFQSKNPGRMRSAIPLMPPWTILGTTIETNRLIPDIGNAPSPVVRMEAMQDIRLRFPEYRRFVTIEPVLDFDVDILADWIRRINPEFLNLGADSKKNNLPEPTAEKIMALVDKLKEYGIELREKHNLQRLTNSF
jgi:DNA repair photolyase